jgi:hypothetical protein
MHRSSGKAMVSRMRVGVSNRRAGVRALPMCVDGVIE